MIGLGREAWWLGVGTFVYVVTLGKEVVVLSLAEGDFYFYIHCKL